MVEVPALQTIPGAAREERYYNTGKDGVYQQPVAEGEAGNHGQVAGLAQLPVYNWRLVKIGT